MARVTLNISSGFNRDESLAIAATDCVNVYPHFPSGQTVTEGSVIGCAGIEEVCNTAVNHFSRGGFVLGDSPYFVNGDKLFRIDYTTDVYGVRTYSAVDVSGAESIEGTDDVFMASNGDQLVIVAPDYNNQFNAWIYTTGGGLVQVSDVDFDGPVLSVDYAYGFFIFPKAYSNKWFISDLRDGSSYIATDFASAESDPDPIVRIAPLNGMVYVFGSRTLEPYQIITGTPDFPFESIPTAVQQKGCVAPKSLIESDGMLIWVGSGENERPSIYASNGGAPQKISTPAIDTYIYSGGIEQLRKTYCIRWSERGHTFLSFTVPQVCTLVYDMTTQKWHERKSLDRFGEFQPWRVKCLVDAYSVLLVGDELSGVIGRMDESIYYEYDEEIRRWVTTPAFDNGGKPFSLYQVELVAETGTNPLTGQGSSPMVGLSLSYDGGRTYSPQIYRVMGLTGQYRNPITWPNLGRFSRSCVLKLSISEPIKIVFVKLEAEIGN